MDNQQSKDIAVGALFPDLAPVAQQFDRLVDVGKGVKTAMLILAGALVLHTIVLIATRPNK
jgi:hypothetical protein